MKRVPPRRRTKVSARVVIRIFLLAVCSLLALLYAFSDRVEPSSLKGPLLTVERNPTSSSRRRFDDDDPCRSYDGVLHISKGDKEGAATTIFFFFVLNQLIYADLHNLLPWVHMDNFSQWIYDPVVHGQDGVAQFLMPRGEFAQPLNGTDGCPSGPIPESTITEEYRVVGNGVWASYFEPVSEFEPQRVATSSCRNKPLVRLSFRQILNGLHLSCLHSVRSWRYGGTTEEARKPHLSYHDWLGENRQRGAVMIQRYYRPTPELLASVRRANPHRQCLAAHIRHSDKANRRKRIKIMQFLPYIEVYLRLAPATAMVFLATDSSEVMNRIQQTWPPNIVNRIHTQDSGSDMTVIRSPNRSAVFKLAGANQHHRTNKEVLTDALAMSNCQYILHGLSAVSEAAIYWNFALHNNSVNLEDRNYMRLDVFERLVGQGFKVTTS